MKHDVCDVCGEETLIVEDIDGLGHCRRCAEKAFEVYRVLMFFESPTYSFDRVVEMAKGVHRAFHPAKAELRKAA